jgi:hypothetical protein
MLVSLTTIALIMLVNAWVHGTMCKLLRASAIFNRSLGHARALKGWEKTILRLYAAHLIWAMSLL